MREVVDLKITFTVVNYDQIPAFVITNVSEMFDLLSSHWTRKLLRRSFRLRKRLVTACVAFLINAKSNTDVVNTERRNEDGGRFVGEFVWIRNNLGLPACEGHFTGNCVLFVVWRTENLEMGGILVEQKIANPSSFTDVEQPAKMWSDSRGRWVVERDM